MKSRNSIALTVIIFAFGVHSQGIAVTAKGAPKSNDALRAKKCLEKGRRLESIASQEGPDNERQFKEALNAYLCAAKEGSAEGAYLAVNLAGGGMAPALSESTQRTLLLQALSGGINDALFGLADLDRQNDPKATLSWLSKAKKSDTTGTAPFQMAELFLSDLLSIQDSAAGYACLKEIGGEKSIQRMRRMLAANPRLDTSVVCEVRR